MGREHDVLTIQQLTYGVDGLIPAVVQQHDTGEVLMVAWMNAEAVRLTCESGTTWFWSRSRQEYWNKGATSGNTQAVIEVKYDCDADCLLVLVDQGAGVACHTGERSCFYRSLCGDGASAAGGSDLGATLRELWDVIEDRRRQPVADSYTTKLLTGPVDKILKKLGEETTEVVIAAHEHDKDHLCYEVSDLIYHLLVVMSREGVAPEDVARELDSRRR
jgi:phosphoribosyl-AMP cyclohydrolase / phosphoribosyl-ATP pyrophosphohydrolase